MRGPAEARSDFVDRRATAWRQAQTDRNPVEILSEEFLERIRRGEAVTPEEYAEHASRTGRRDPGAFPGPA